MPRYSPIPTNQDNSEINFTIVQMGGIDHCNIPKVVSYAKWWYGIFQYHTTIHPISYHYLNSGMILENTIPPFAIRKRQSS